MCFTRLLSPVNASGRFLHLAISFIHTYELQSQRSDCPEFFQISCIQGSDEGGGENEELGERMRRLSGTRHFLPEEYLEVPDKSSGRRRKEVLLDSAAEAGEPILQHVDSENEGKRGIAEEGIGGEDPGLGISAGCRRIHRRSRDTRLLTRVNP